MNGILTLYVHTDREDHLRVSQRNFFLCLLFQVNINFRTVLDAVNTHSYHHTGAEDGLCSVDQADLRYAQMHASAPDPPGSYEFLVLADLLMSENELCFPENIGDALNFYTELTVLVEDAIGW